MAMRFIDLFIIYLAMGSPFAVSLYLQDHSTTIVRRTLVFLYGLLAWPILASAMVYRLSPGKRIASERSADLVRVRNELEQVCLRYCTTGHAFVLRDALERYIGISIAAAQQSSNAAAEIFDIAEHPQPTTATMCLSRINLRKLQFHQTAARDELLRAVAQLGTAANGRALDLLRKLGKAVNDERFPADLHNVLNLHQFEDSAELRSAA
jgi:hypothetical protein